MTFARPLCSEEEAEAVRGLYLLTAKPVTYAANVAESDLADMGATNPHVKALREKAAEEGREVVIVSAQVRQHGGQANIIRNFADCIMLLLSCHYELLVTYCVAMVRRWKRN